MIRWLAVPLTLAATAALADTPKQAASSSAEAEVGYTIAFFEKHLLGK